MADTFPYMDGTLYNLPLCRQNCTTIVILITFFSSFFFIIIYGLNFRIFIHFRNGFDVFSRCRNIEWVKLAGCLYCTIHPKHIKDMSLIVWSDIKMNYDWKVVMVTSFPFHNIAYSIWAKNILMNRCWTIYNAVMYAASLIRISLNVIVLKFLVQM